MDAMEFLGLAPDGPRRWSLPVTRGLSSGVDALFGGCALAAAVEALEHDIGRPLVWASAQFLSFAHPPDVVVFETSEVARGREVSQARAVGRVDDVEIVAVHAALGERPRPAHGEWAVRPDVPPPDSCPPRVLPDRMRGTILDRVHMRIASTPFGRLGRSPDGRSALWVKLPDGLPTSAAALAIVGDHVPYGIRMALGDDTSGNSLDNTLRMVSRAATEWVLADVRVQAVRDGFGHGIVHLWSQEGRLLGTASQSTIVRPLGARDTDDA